MRSRFRANKNKNLQEKKANAPVKRSFGIVRDRNGNIKARDPHALPPEIIAQLSDDEKSYLGIWQDAVCSDADGMKRLTKVGKNEYIANDALRAVSTIYDNGKAYKVNPRKDIPQGEKIILENE